MTMLGIRYPAVSFRGCISQCCLLRISMKPIILTLVYSASPVHRTSTLRHRTGVQIIRLYIGNGRVAVWKKTHKKKQIEKTHTHKKKRIDHSLILHWYCWWFGNPANQLICKISHYLQGFGPILSVVFSSDFWTINSTTFCFQFRLTTTPRNLDPCCVFLTGRFIWRFWGNQPPKMCVS